MATESSFVGEGSRGLFVLGGGEVKMIDNILYSSPL